MRIGNSSLERKSEYLEVLPKIFVMMEGTDTEPIYFKELFSRISNIEYLPFEREIGDLGWSNPLLLMNEIKLELDCKNICLSYKEFLPFLVKYLKMNNSDLDVSLFKSEFNKQLFKNHILDRTQIVDEPIIEVILNKLKTTAFINLVYDGLENFKATFTSLRDESCPYNPSTDRLILIIDRDKTSFSKSQFEKVVEEGKKNNVEIFMTNPCFEFYLALHFSDLKSYSETDLLDNKKMDDKTFCHSILLLFDVDFTKTSYDAKKYVLNISNVLDNIQKYENDLLKLESRVGTNLNVLLNSLKIK